MSKKSITSLAVVGLAIATGGASLVGNAVAGVVGATVTATTATAIGAGIVAGTVTAAQGGSTSDILKSAVLTGIGSGIGAGIAADVAYETAISAISSGVSGTTSVALGNLLGAASVGALTGGTSAIADGKDPIDAMIKGGLTAGLTSGVMLGVDAITKDVPGFGAPSNTAEAALQRAVKTAAAASIVGQSGTTALTNSLTNSFMSIATDYVGKKIVDAASGMLTSKSAADAAKSKIDENVAQQNDYSSRYNSLAEKINSEYAKVSAAEAAYNNAHGAWVAVGGDTPTVSATLAYLKSTGQAGQVIPPGYMREQYGISAPGISINGNIKPMPIFWRDLLNANNDAVNNYNTVSAEYQTYYNQQKPTLDSYKTSLDNLKTALPDVEKTYTDALTKLKSSVSDFQVQEIKNYEVVANAINEVDTAQKTFSEKFGIQLDSESLKALAASGNITDAANAVADGLSEIDAVDRAAAIKKLEKGIPSFLTYVDQKNVSVAEVKDAAEKEGVTLTDEQARAFAGAKDQATALAEVERFADPLATLSSEAQQFFRQVYGRDGGPDEIASYINQTEPNALAGIQKSNIESLLTKAGLTESDLTTEQSLNALLVSPTERAKYIQTLADIKDTTFDASQYASREEAIIAAQKAGYNTFAQDGMTYTIMSGKQGQKMAQAMAAGQLPADQVSILDDAGNVLNFDDGNVPEIVITAKRIDAPLPSDATAYREYMDFVDANGGRSATKFFSDQLNILTEAFKDANPGTAADVLKNALAYGARSFGSLSSTLVSVAEAAGLDKNSAAQNISKTLERWGKANQAAGIMDAEKAFSDSINNVTKASVAAKYGIPESEVSAARVAAEQVKELVNQSVKNPLGAGSTLLTEGLQEIPFLVASGGVGRVVAGVAGKAIGFAAARSTDAALNGLESFGGNYAEVIDRLQKSGVTGSKAESRAITSGLEAMGVTMLTSFAGDSAIVRSFMGDAAKLAFKDIATAGVKEFGTGYIEGAMQNASVQMAVYGKINNMAEVTASGAIEGFVQSGVTTGTLSKDKLGQVVAKDYDGGNVTLGDIVNGTKSFNPATLNSSAELSSGVTLGDALSYKTTFDSAPDVSPTEYAQTAKFFRAEGLNNPTEQDILAIVGSEGEKSAADLQKDATSYADARVVSTDEATQMLTDLGYTNPTAEQIGQFAGVRSEADTRTAADQWVNANTVSRDEARQTLIDLGYTNPPDTLIDKLVGQYEESKLTTKAEGLGIATKDDITNAIANIKFPTGANKQDVADAIQTYMDAHPGVTADQIAEKITAATAGLATPSDVQTAIDSALTASEATQSAQLSEVQRSLSDEIQAAKDIGLEGDAAIQAGLDSLAKKVGINQADLLAQLGTTAADLKTQFAADIAASQGSTAQDIADTKTALETAIADAKAAGLEGDAALKAAIDAVAADQQTNAADLLTKLGATEETLRTEFGAGLAGVSAEVKAAYDSLSAEQKTLADQLTQQGTDLATAIQAAQEQAVGAIETLSADVQAKYDALTAEQKSLADAMAQQGLDLTAAIDLAAQQTQAQITGIGQQVDTRINELMQQGQTYQQATQQAFAEINAQNKQLAEQLGAQGRSANQSDIDVLTQMVAGQVAPDAAYDVNGDKQITQADIDFLTGVVSNANANWRPTTGPWAATGLYGQMQANEWKRQDDLAAAKAAQDAKDAEAARQAAEQQKQAAVNAKIAQIGSQTQRIADQLPAAAKAAQTTYDPIYGGTMQDFNLESPLDIGFFGPRGSNQAGQNKGQTAKIATGGYLDDLLDLLR